MGTEHSMDQVFINKVINILEVNLTNEQFGVKELSKEVGISRAQLHRKLHTLLGKSTSQFIREFRLDKAMEMLQNNAATASEIAYNVGFKSPTYFNTSFREYHGYTPGEVKFRNPSVIENSEGEQTKQSALHDQDKSVTLSIEKISSRQRMLLLFSLGILLIIAFSYYFYFNSKETKATKTIETVITDKSIAIIPFKYLSNEKEDEYFAAGVMGSIHNHLRKINGLKVISEKSMEKYADTIMTASEIANEIGVTFLLDGSVQKIGDSIRIIAHLINAKSDQQLTSMIFDWEYKNVFTLQSKIAMQIAEELDITISPTELEQIKKKPTDNLEAYRLYLNGRFFWHQRTEKDLNKSIYYFKKALDQDSTYALAYTGLADAYFIMAWWGWIPKNEGFNKGKEFAKKAIAIDNNIAEAHATLGAIITWSEWNWIEAEKELKLAIFLNANNATAHQYYSELLDILGRNEEAREQIDLALELNPYSYAMNVLSAYYYYNSNDYYKAVEAHKKTIDIANKNNHLILINKHSMIRCYLNLGMNNNALELIKDLISIDNHQLLNKIFEESGINGVINWFIDWILVNKKQINYSYTIARFYSCIGDSQNTLKYLEYFYEEGATYLPRMKNSSDFSFIKTEPRYIALLNEMGLKNHVNP